MKEECDALRQQAESLKHFGKENDDLQLKVKEGEKWKQKYDELAANKETNAVLQGMLRRLY